MSMLGREALFGICEKALRAVGYDLVDLDYGCDGGKWVLRVFIDHPWNDDELRADPKRRKRIGFDDCGRASRQLSTVLDVEDPIPGTYRLEVSSPGVHRRLRKVSDFARFVGYNVTVRMNHPREGRRTFKGLLRSVGEDHVTVKVNGQEVSLPINDIKKANLNDEF